ncbi:MAG: hypothetical protein ACRCX8_06875 [Sarcina sp.]
MNKEELKKYLKDNPQKIELILEEIGCHHIKVGAKRIQSARPGGDNPTSICINLNDALTTTVWTKNDFEEHSYKDFYGLVGYIADIKFDEVLGLICKICGIKYDHKIIKKKKSSIGALKGLIGGNKNVKIEEKVIDEKVKEQFVRETCELFLKDNISDTAQEKFYVSYDVLENRVVFPIRNYEGRIVTFKGRTMEKDYKLKGIPKYYYYYPSDVRNYLFGYYENYFDICCSKEIVVFEAEKSIMQCDSFGHNNTLAVSKKIISQEQVKRLLNTGKDIVLAFDKGVSLEDIYIECRKFKKLCNVYYIYDCDDVLKDKESPSDEGKEVYEKLLNNYKFKYEGE